MSSDSENQNRQQCDYSDDESEGQAAGGKAGLVKRSWTPEEDVALLAAVEKYGACRWSIIATHLSTGRVGKQCRERWNNHLCPDVKKSEWSDEEDRSILHGVAELGTRWCEIVKAPALVGRTDNAIKNRFYALQRRMKAAHSAAVRAAAAPPETASPLGKRQWSATAAEDERPAAPRSEAETYLETREKIVSIATALAFSVDEADRDRLISKLTATLHPRPRAEPPTAADGRGGGGGGGEAERRSASVVPHRHSPLSASHMTGDAASDMAAFLDVARGMGSPTASTPGTLSPLVSPVDSEPRQLRGGAVERATERAGGGEDDDSSDGGDGGGDEADATAEDAGWAEGVVCGAADCAAAAGAAVPLSLGARRGAALAPMRCGLLAGPPSLGSAGSMPSLRSDEEGDDDEARLAPSPRAAAGAAPSEAAAGGDAMDTGQTPQTGTEEPGAVGAAGGERAALGACLGGRHRYRLLLAPLAIPEAEAQGGVEAMPATAAAAGAHLDSAKRQRTPSGHTPGGGSAAARGGGEHWAEAAAPPPPPLPAPPQQQGTPSGAAGTEEPGAPLSVWARGGSPLGTHGAAEASPPRPQPAAAAASPGGGGALAALPEHLQLSFFTDLFADASLCNSLPSLAPAAERPPPKAAAPPPPAAAASPAASPPNGGSRALVASPPERPPPRRPSPLVPPQPRRATRHTNITPIAAA